MEVHKDGLPLSKSNSMPLATSDYTGPRRRFQATQDCLVDAPISMHTKTKKGNDSP